VLKNYIQLIKRHRKVLRKGIQNSLQRMIYSFLGWSINSGCSIKNKQRMNTHLQSNGREPKWFEALHCIDW